jgi:ferric-dicitrate binding protein FerR (iron transport regulator)
MNKEILKRFFEGKSNNWEKKQVQDYLQGDHLNLLDEYIKEQDAIHPPAVDEQYKLMFFEELTSNIKQQQNQVNERKITRFSPWFKIAAAVIIICTASGLLYLKRQKQAAAETGTLLTKITNKGRNLKMVELADGTKIWMNPGTTITYNKRNFAGSLRQVSLIGEAYFNVTHDVKKPFQVRAGKLTTTVLGTSFNIEAYENEAETRVMLVTGSVRVNAGKSQEMLRPGQLLGFSRKNEQVNVKSVDISDKQELFTHGKLVFENLPLKEALKRVERTFELKISVSDESLLDNKRITGNYYRDNAELALTRILFIHGLHHHKKGDHNYVIEQ